jgi:hypothetical protein
MTTFEVERRESAPPTPPAAGSGAGSPSDWPSRAPRFALDMDAPPDEAIAEL